MNHPLIFRGCYKINKSSREWPSHKVNPDFFGSQRILLSIALY
uniref:Uncharacterized protein n=1 Tax=Rhizophora mucronata TaxID=61149 RepID=A0A2P2JT21_RHIMU